MFGISLPEVVLILIIIIIFVRPEDLPKFLRSAGRLYGKAKRMYKEVIGVTNQVVKEINSIADLNDTPKSATPKKLTPQNPPAQKPTDSPEKEPYNFVAPNENEEGENPSLQPTLFAEAETEAKTDSEPEPSKQE
jgi:Sec-independent protein translocase protein TatA